MAVATKLTGTRGEPRRISEEDFRRHYPVVRLKVIEGGVAVERTGQVIGRTIAGVSRYDVRLPDGKIIANVDAAECEKVSA